MVRRNADAVDARFRIAEDAPTPEAFAHEICSRLSDRDLGEKTDTAAVNAAPAWCTCWSHNRRHRGLEFWASVPMMAWLAIEIGLSGYFLLYAADPHETPLTTMSRLADLVSSAVVVVLYCVRSPPTRKAPGLWPRAIALVGFLSPLLVLALPRAVLPAPVQVIASAAFLAGTVATAVAIVWLGRAFSIFPQARHLVTSGPYRFVRHPVYLAELVTVWAGMVSFEQPWAMGVALTVTAVQIVRLRMEEAVLRETFPAYQHYARSTARLIPGVY